MCEWEEKVPLKSRKYLVENVVDYQYKVLSVTYDTQVAHGEGERGP